MLRFPRCLHLARHASHIVHKLCTLPTPKSARRRKTQKEQWTLQMLHFILKSRNIFCETQPQASIALWRYPHVKWEIELLSQITTTAPIFLQFNYFRQKYLEIASSAVSLLNYIWVRVEHSLLQKLDLQKVNCSSSSLQAGCE